MLRPTGLRRTAKPAVWLSFLPALCESMNLTLVPILTGLEITNGEDKLIFANKLFSLFPVIKDESAVIFATLKRKGWLHLTFSLATPDGKYKLEQKWGESQLTLDRTDEILNTNSGLEFYTAHGVRVTEFQRAQALGSRYSLAVHKQDHALALIMTSCLFYKTTIESVGVTGG